LPQAPYTQTIYRYREYCPDTNQDVTPTPTPIPAVTVGSPYTFNQGIETSAVAGCASGAGICDTGWFYLPWIIAFLAALTAFHQIYRRHQLEQKIRRVSAKKPCYGWQVILPGAVVGLGLVGLCFYLVKAYCSGVDVAPLPPIAYQLTGTANWVEGRTWQLRDPDSDRLLTQSDTTGQILLVDYPAKAKLMLQHQDWQVRYLLTVQPDPECDRLALASAFSDDLAACAKKHSQIITLDHELDDWLGQWRTALLLRDWEKLLPLIQLPTEGPSLQQQLDDWVNSLVAAGWSTSSLDLYLDLDTSSPVEQSILLFWTLQNEAGQQVVQTKKLVLSHLADNGWQWRYTPESLPQI
jgi:hypothetical protein